jgi:hypothetical protein
VTLFKCSHGRLYKTGLTVAYFRKSVKWHRVPIRIPSYLTDFFKFTSTFLITIFCLFLGISKVCFWIQYEKVVLHCLLMFLNSIIMYPSAELFCMSGIYLCIYGISNAFFYPYLLRKCKLVAINRTFSEFSLMSDDNWNICMNEFVLDFLFRDINYVVTIYIPIRIPSYLTDFFKFTSTFLITIFCFLILNLETNFGYA